MRSDARRIIISARQFAGVPVATRADARVVVVQFEQVELFQLVELSHAGIHQPRDAGIDQFGPLHQVNHSLFHSVPPDEVVPGREPVVLQAHLAHRQDAAKYRLHGVEACLRVLGVNGHDRQLDLLDIRHAGNLRCELLRLDPLLLHLKQLPFLGDAESRAAPGDPAGQIVAHDHVPGEVFPLVEFLPHLTLDFLRPGGTAPQRQFVIDVDLLPGNLVDPQHGSDAVQPVEL